MRQHQTEVLVAGAGPVGMFTALMLAREGVKVQIIDREARTAGHSYACALHPRSLELLDLAGISGDILNKGRRINTIVFYAGGARAAEVNLNTLRSKFPYVLVLEQSLLEDLLEQKLRQNGVSVDWQHRLADLAMDDNGVTVSIEKLGTTGKGYGVPEFGLGVEKSLETRADFLVAADGHRSITRDRLGIKYKRTRANGRCSLFSKSSRTPPWRTN